MAQSHRLEVELLGEGAAHRCPPTDPVESQKRSLTHTTPAQRVSRVPGTFDSLGMKVP
jgi:hypothetical protein